MSSSHRFVSSQPSARLRIVQLCTARRSTRAHRPEYPIGIPVHLLQVYSNPAPGVVAPQELLFRSRSREKQPTARAPRRRARQLRADQAELVVTRYLAVRNIRTVAKEFQVSRTTVARILTKRGVDASRRMTHAQITVAAGLYEQGLSSAAIGQRLGFDNHTVLKALRGCGIEIRARATTDPLKGAADAD